MKKTFFMLLIISTALFFSSCDMLINVIKKPEEENFKGLTKTQEEKLVRYAYTAYNKGYNYTFEQIKGFADNPSYIADDNVLAFYKYLNGEVTLDSIKTRSEDREKDKYDSRVADYIKEIYSKLSGSLSNQNSDGIFNKFDDEVPVKANKYRTDHKNNFNPPLIPFSNRTFLVTRVKDLLDYYKTSSEFFKPHFAKVFTESVDTFDTQKYSEMLVDLSYAYIGSNLSFTSSIDNSFFRSSVIIKDIPVEMVLAFFVQESRLLPGSFRAEISSENIYAVSFGLAHTLIDADFLEIAAAHDDIGNNDAGGRNFDIISSRYLGNTAKQKTYFSDYDLLTVRGSLLYSSIFMQLLYQKLITYKDSF